MWLVYYRIKVNYFVIQAVNFSIDFYDDLAAGYINRDGDLLVLILIYNIRIKEWEVTSCYWLWSQIQSLALR